ncbi:MULTISPECIES: phospholipid-binding protein MlaC [unclassified Gilliamella]|jgi:phospholipid transport system substrate-binding protein|uniref:phospholipid-binding protein MlaC n=1 Tax=unclassified Gilliamella TaxID=2685620 RepID=UPI00080E4723|nr:phospholipid-binding protein MlaC [Gilliamella apicola]OCG25728.1 ABC transporter substrate-binding protein [Gilliamella apicola]OCG28848.1 ABC transporter substrate-binding protein [Gilliamella apicola]OCG31990.1 ABC transporter substrate-binding protein [Gilliamella apicola]OCG59336.1 ABC transporter substrate-binding protein [Gilliamella apicola]OCG67537.1 ABC transporter substrate-binding protein [Gilliamella apicola]
MLNKFKTTLFLALALLFSANTFAENDPYKEMQVAADKIFTTMKSQSSVIKSNPNRLKDIVRQDLLPYVQVKYAGALILGNYYKSASEAQRTAYFDAFENYLVQTFAQALSMYNGQQYQVEAAKDLTGKNLISIRVLLIQPNQGQPLRIDFQWRKNTVTGEWKAYDLVAEGVSMISTKQNEWSSILRQGGIDALTKQLTELSNRKIDPNTKPKG